MIPVVNTKSNLNGSGEQIKYFYSNCLFVAIYMKLKHRSKIKLRVVGPIRNYRMYKVFCPHVYWIWKDTGKKTSFHTDATLKFPFYYLPFKGYVKGFSSQEEKELVS